MDFQIYGFRVYTYDCIDILQMVADISERANKKIKIILLLYNARRTFNLHGTFRDFSLIFRKAMWKSKYFISKKSSKTNYSIAGYCKSICN